MARAYSDWDYLPQQSKLKGDYSTGVEKLGLEVIELSFPHPHIYLCEGSFLAQKEISHMEDIADLPGSFFTREKDEYLYYSENFVDTSASSQMFNVTDRHPLNDILEDGRLCDRFWIFLDRQCVNGFSYSFLR